MSLKDSIKKHEGFKKYPYIDPLVAKDPEKYGIPKDEFDIIKKHFDKLKVTFGYGFTHLEPNEAEAVLDLKIKNRENLLRKYISYYDELPRDIREMLIEMSYQLGVGGVMKFRKMLAALRREKWCKAYDEGKDSHWYQQTPKRAEEVLQPLKKRCNRG